MTEDDPIVIAGAGVAGLAAACRLQGNAHVPFLVLERNEQVGGCSRTLERDGFRFDLGGHRFYSRKPEIERFVRDLVGDDLLTVDRMSHIRFNDRFVDYPLRPLSTLHALGPIGAACALRDYAAMKLQRLVDSHGSEQTFEQWALHRFGEYLYRVYFKVYTEKTWGVPCSELSADFAEQRIKGLSFREAVKDAIFKTGEDDSLVRRFLYPRHGFGQIPEAMARSVEPPNSLACRRRVVAIEHRNGQVSAVRTVTPEGREQRWPCGELISSIPLDETVHILSPPAPPEVTRAAAGLCYRDMVILLLLLDRKQVSKDHWIYVPSQEVEFCRLHEPRNWSPEMAPPGRTSLVVEYFCQAGDRVWEAPASQLAAAAAGDLEKMDLIAVDEVSGHWTVRLRKAYPVYRLGYRRRLDTVNDYLDGFANLHRVGRNAAFLYTSSDHYMDMGLKAAENVLGHRHDLSMIGREPGYAER